MSVTRRDIVRYLNDEVSDPDELQRIEVELARDPQLRQWYRELDFESMVPSEPANDQIDPELARFARTLVGDHRRSEVWRLDIERPLSDLLSREVAAAGQIVRREGYETSALACRIERVSDAPPTFSVSLTQATWPEGYRVFDVIVGKLVLEPGVPAAQPQEAQVSLPMPGRQSAAAEAQPELALHELAARDAEPRRAWSQEGDCGKFHWKFSREHHQYRLDVTRPAISGRQQQYVVAELRYHRGTQEQPVCLRRVLRMAPRADKSEFAGNVAFSLQDAVSTEVSIRVVPLQVADLYLLSPGNITPLLADQDVATLPVREGPHAGQLTFRVRFPEQQRKVEDPVASRYLLLQVAPPEKED